MDKKRGSQNCSRLLRRKPRRSRNGETVYIRGKTGGPKPGAQTSWSSSDNKFRCFIALGYTPAAITLHGQQFLGAKATPHLPYTLLKAPAFPAAVSVHSTPADNENCYEFTYTDLCCISKRLPACTFCISSLFLFIIA